MSIEEKIRKEVHPPMRIAWDGIKVMMVNDVSIKEIDGVIERLERAKTSLAKQPGKLVMLGGPIEIKL